MAKNLDFYTHKIEITDLIKNSKYPIINFFIYSFEEPNVGSEKVGKVSKLFSFEKIDSS